jgi:Protein of unknown function (DUF533)
VIGFVQFSTVVWQGVFYVDAIEILGGLLGNKSGGSGMGAKILKDIFLGGNRNAPKTPAPRPESRSSAPPVEQHFDLDREASRLEDLLNVATDRRNTSSPNQQSSARRSDSPNFSPPASNASRQQGSQYEQRQTIPFPNQKIPPQQYDSRPNVAESQNDQAMILVQAMINAAKCDGEINQDEQNKIMSQFQNASQEVVQYLRQEFAKRLDVRDFAWSVPIGMEQQVYMISLTSIELDRQNEVDYLRALAHGLRLGPTVCNQIHQRLGIQSIF